MVAKVISQEMRVRVQKLEIIIAGINKDLNRVNSSIGLITGVRLKSMVKELMLFLTPQVNVLF